MNILFISHDSSHTGAPLALLSLVRAIREHIPEVRCTVLILKDGPLTIEFGKECPVIIPQRKPWCLQNLFVPSNLIDRLSIRLFLKHIKHQHFDLIYANSAYSLHCAIVLKEILHITVLLHLHESGINRCYIDIRQSWIHACDHFIAVSPLARQCLADLGADLSKISVIFPTSVFIEQLLNSKDVQEKTTKMDSAKTIVGFVGPLINRKGGDLLPIVLRRLCDRHPDFDFEIRSVGNDHDLERKCLEYDAHRLCVSDKIRFIDPLEDPITVYTEMDMLLVLSREESFSLVVPEFGLLGKPAILFNGSCGVQHFLQHEHNALIVPYLDLDGIADAIYRLGTNDDEKHRMGENLRQVMTEHYTHHDTNGQIINLLREYIS